MKHEIPSTGLKQYDGYPMDRMGATLGATRGDQPWFLNVTLAHPELKGHGKKTCLEELKMQNINIG